MNKANINIFIRLVIQKFTVVLSLVAIIFSVFIFTGQFKSFEKNEIILSALGAGAGIVVSYFLILLKESINSPKIYIYYSEQDYEFAKKIYNNLSLTPFIPLIDKYDINVGDNIDDKTKEMIENSDYIIFIPSSVDRIALEYEEMEKFINLNKKIFPIKLGNYEIPDFLKDRKYADFSESFEEGMSELIKALKLNKNNINPDK